MSYPRQQSPEVWATQLNFAAIERQHGLPAGVLTNLVRQESRGNCDARSPVGAYGLCQFMPATARERGVNASDPVSSINGAANYLEDLMDMFGGDAEKAIAAYNWGQGNMRRAIRNHGENWREHLPAETRNYLQVVGRGIGRGYVQRQQAGETISEEEQKAEAARRNGRLAEAGLPEMNLQGILGSFFFALIASFLENKMSEMDSSAPAPVPSGPQTITDGNVPPPERTPPAPRQVAASRSNAPVPA